MNPRRVYFGVYGTGERRLEPATITAAAGLVPSQAWRIGDPGGRIPRRFDTWQLESPAGYEAPVTEQIESLLDVLDGVAEALRFATDGYEPCVNVVLETGRQASTFEVSAASLQTLAAIGATLGCDLYWACERGIVDGRCVNCKLALPATVLGIQSYVDREEVADVSFALGPSADGSMRRQDVRFVSGDDFTKALKAFLADAPLDGSLHIDMTEHGTYQGTTGIFLEDDVPKWLASANCALTVRLAFDPYPNVDETGSCAHCGRCVLVL